MKVPGEQAGVPEKIIIELDMEFTQIVQRASISQAKKKDY